MSGKVYVVIETCRHEGIQEVLKVFYTDRALAEATAVAKNAAARRLEIEEAQHWVASRRIKAEGARGALEVECTRRKLENAVAELETVEQESRLTTRFIVIELEPAE